MFVAFVAIVAASYYPAWHGAPIWDDDAHMTAMDLRSLSGLWRIWFEFGATQQYYPVAHSAFWVMSRLWGDVTLGYHLVNVTLHATSALLVVLILQRLRIPGSLLAGLLFAVHPVHVESVAWMTELKNTLSGAFYLTAMLVYLRFDRRRAVRDYVLALTLFLLALMSKSVTATLPAALLVIFWERRGTLSWRRDALPLVPFFSIGLLAGLLTAWVERTYIGAVGTVFNLSLVERCLVAGRVVVFYLGKLAWPHPLIFFYPRWQVSGAVWWQYLYPLGVVAAVVALWAVRGRSRAPLAALLFFIGTIGPALGFVNVFPFKYSFVADHFQYLASLGAIVLVAAAWATLADRQRLPAQARELLPALVLGAPLALLTFHQSGQYVDKETLYRTTIARNPGAWLAHNNLGVSYLQAMPPQPDRAFEEFNTALALDPDEPMLHFNVATSLYQMGRLEEALVRYRDAVRLAPGYAEAWGNLAISLHRLGRYEEAVSTYRIALQIKPDMPGIRTDLGVALQALGRMNEASVELRAGLQNRASTAQDHANLADILRSQGRPAEAIAEYQQALSFEPDSPQVLSDLGYVLTQERRFTEAEPILRRAVALAPDSAAAHDNLGNVLQQTGRLRDALVEYNAALTATGDLSRPDIHNDMGVALAKLGLRDESIAHFREAIRLKPGFAAAEANLQRAMAMQ